MYAPMDPSIAGYVAATEAMASQEDAAAAQQELIRARKVLGGAAIFIVIVAILQIVAMPSAWATVTVPGNPGTYSLIPTKGVTLCYQGSCATVTYDEINDSAFEASSKATIPLCVLCLVLSLAGLLGVFGLRKRVRVASNAVSLAPAMAVPVLAALAHPFAFSVILSLAAIISHINWIQYVAVSHKMIMFNQTNFDYNWSTGIIAVFISGIFLFMSAFAVRRAGYRILAAGTLNQHASFHAHNAQAAAASMPAVPYALPVLVAANVF